MTETLADVVDILNNLEECEHGKFKADTRRGLGRGAIKLSKY